MDKITATTTARSIIEARIGRPLGPVADMAASDRKALSALAKALVAARAPRLFTRSVRDLVAR